MMSEETFKTWKRMKETQEFFDYLKEEESAHRFMAAIGPNLSESNEQIVRQYLNHINQAEVYNKLIELKYEDLNNVKEDTEDQAARASSINSA